MSVDTLSIVGFVCLMGTALFIDIYVNYYRGYYRWR